MGLVRNAVCALLLPCMQLAVAADRPPLKLCYEDVSAMPWTRPDGTGLNLELLRAAEKNLQERFIYVARPWKRCIEEMRNGDFDGVFAAGESAERRTFGVFPTLPSGAIDPARALHEDRFQVFLRKGSAASWDGKTLLPTAKGVLAQRGYMIAGDLRVLGLDVKESTNSAHDALRQLAMGMFDMAVIQGPEAAKLLQTDSGMREKVMLSPIPYAVRPMFLLVAKPTYARDPKRIESIWTFIGETRKSSQYRANEAKALLLPLAN